MKKIFFLLIYFVFVTNISFADINIDNIVIEKDLNFLTELSNEELKPLVKIIINNGKNSSLSKWALINPKQHLAEIIDELERYAGNTFANVFRNGKGVPYRKILEEVCKIEDIEKEGITVTKFISTKVLGKALVSKKFNDAIDNMTEEEKEEFVKNLQQTIGVEKTGNVLKLKTPYKVAGAKTFNKLYKNNKVFRKIINSLPKILKNYLVGPLGAIIVSFYCINEDLAGPATRVTIPAVTYIEYMRIVKGD